MADEHSISHRYESRLTCLSGENWVQIANSPSSSLAGFRTTTLTFCSRPTGNRSQRLESILGRPVGNISTAHTRAHNRPFEGQVWTRQTRDTRATDRRGNPLGPKNTNRTGHRVQSLPVVYRWPSLRALLLSCFLMHISYLYKLHLYVCNGSLSARELS